MYYKILFVLITSSFIFITPARGKYFGMEWLFINDRLAELGEIPSIIALEDRYANKHICGGILVDERHVVTAASCVYNQTTDQVIEPVSIRLIGSDLTLHGNNSTTRQVRHAKRIFCHPHFNKKLRENDIALIQLALKFDMSNYLNYIALAENRDAIENKCFTVGWTVRHIFAHSYKLHVTDVVRNISFCNSKIPYNGTNSADTLCVGATGNHGLKGNKSQHACHFEYGGPLICNNQLFGILSYGYGCGRGLTALYTDVVKHFGWLDTTMKNENYKYHTNNDGLRHIINHHQQVMACSSSKLDIGWITILSATLKWVI